MKWSETEEHLLKAIYPTATKQDVIAALPQRNWGRIVEHAHLLGLKRRWFRPPLDRVPEIVLTNIDKARIAMLIDTEGSIWVQFDRNVNHYHPVISVCNTDRRLIDYFREKCNVPSIVKFQAEGRNRKARYHSSIYELGRIYAVLKHIRPYFIIKGCQADLILELIEIWDRIRREAPHRRTSKTIGNNPRILEIVREMAIRNKKGPPVTCSGAESSTNTALTKC